MDYKKVLSVLALAAGVAGASESMAMVTIPAEAPNAAEINSLFQASEVSASGVLMARDKGCMANQGCFGLCAGRKDRKKNKSKDKSCAGKKGESSCAASKSGEASCSAHKSGESSCAASKSGEKSCAAGK